MKAIPIILAAAATAVTLGIAAPASAHWSEHGYHGWNRWHHHYRHHHWQQPYYHYGYYAPPVHHYYAPRPYYRSW